MKINTKIYKDYDFDNHDMAQLKSLASVMLPHKDRLADEFYNRLLENKETARYLPDKFSVEKRKTTMQIWFTELFSGNYDLKYLKGLETIGYLHKKIELDCHYVNSSMHFVRNFCIDIIRDNFDKREDRHTAICSMQKILDINLDVLTLSYREAELKQVFVSKKLEGFLINFCERFSYGMNLMLVLGLVGVSLSVLTLFGHEIYEVVTGHVAMEKGIITALGTLLIIWVMIELMSTEINHLKGGHFPIKVFAEVALVSFIRDGLVTSLHNGDPVKLLYIAGVILMMGIVYWLISRSEKYGQAMPKDHTN